MGKRLSVILMYREVVVSHFEISVSVTNCGKQWSIIRVLQHVWSS
jgi:hypothetical protein